MKGPKPNIKKDLEILALKTQGLSFRAIAKKKNRDVKRVYVAYRRAQALVGVGGLSTVK
jgi:dihydroorotate dehydrogenase